MNELRRARAIKGLTVRALAGQAGINPTTLNQIETGKRKAQLTTLGKLAKALDMPVDAFLDLIDTTPAARGYIGGKISKRTQTHTNAHRSEQNDTTEGQDIPLIDQPRDGGTMPTIGKPIAQDATPRPGPSTAQKIPPPPDIFDDETKPFRYRPVKYWVGLESGAIRSFKTWEEATGYATNPEHGKMRIYRGYNRASEAAQKEHKKFLANVATGVAQWPTKKTIYDCIDLPDPARRRGKTDGKYLGLAES